MKVFACLMQFISRFGNKMWEKKLELASAMNETETERNFMKQGMRNMRRETIAGDVATP